MKNQTDNRPAPPPRGRPHPAGDRAEYSANNTFQLAPGPPPKPKPPPAAPRPAPRPAAIAPAIALATLAVFLCSAWPASATPPPPPTDQANQLHDDHRPRPFRDILARIAARQDKRRAHALQHLQRLRCRLRGQCDPPPPRHQLQLHEQDPQLHPFRTFLLRFWTDHAHDQAQRPLDRALDRRDARDAAAAQLDHDAPPDELAPLAPRFQPLRR